MKNLSYCRRTFIAFFAVTTLGLLGYFKGTDVSIPIATIAIGLAGANAYEKGSVKNQQYRND
jgi:hypothetical protein